MHRAEASQPAAAKRRAASAHFEPLPDSCFTAAHQLNWEADIYWGDSVSQVDTNEEQEDSEDTGASHSVSLMHEPSCERVEDDAQSCGAMHGMYAVAAVSPGPASWVQEGVPVMLHCLGWQDHPAPSLNSHGCHQDLLCWEAHGRRQLLQCMIH